MKKSILFLFLIITLVSCKENYKNKIWTNDDMFFQITDSLVHFNNPYSQNRDYFYSFKDDSIFLNNGFCRAFSLSYKVKNSKNALTLIGFRSQNDKWLYQNDSLNYKIDTFNFHLAKNQNDTLSKRWSIQKELSKSYDCIIEGSWYDSLTRKVLVFEDNYCYNNYYNPRLSSMELIKNKYKCTNEFDFILQTYCSGEFYTIEKRTDNFMKFKHKYSDENEFIYRIKDVYIDTTNYWESDYSGKRFIVDSIDITPFNNLIE